jgi:hypothetical protein
MKMGLFLESLRFDRALFLLRTLSLIIWLAEIEARGVEIRLIKVCRFGNRERLSLQ